MLREPSINARFHHRVEFSWPNEQGQTRILWMLQPHDMPDDDGFDMGDTPEIMFATMHDDEGNYIGPFRPERVPW